MSTLVERLSHQTDKCNSAKGLQVFLNEDNTYSGYCFSCSTYVPDPYGEGGPAKKPNVFVKSPEEIRAEMDEIGECATLDLPERKLRKDSLEYFGIKIGVSEQDGKTPNQHFYPYYEKDELVAYKVRLIEGKKIWSVGNMKNVDLFGWRQAVEAGGKRLFIVEGELDAVALYQICKDHNKGTPYAHLNPAIVSVPKGAASAAKDLARALPAIRRHFKEIVLVFDDDEAGKQATSETLKIIPEAQVAVLPCKDANACLIEGRSKAAYASVTFKAAKPKNTRLVRISSDLITAAKKPPEWGFSYPYERLTELTRGRRFGETYYFGAGVKMGKSELLNDMVAWDIKEHNWRVLVIKPEENNIRTLHGVAGKMEGHIFHDPAVPFNEEAFDRAVELIDDRLVMLNIYQELTWEVIKEDIRVAAADGVKSVYIDPITNFINGMSASDANTLLQKIAQEAAQMAMDLQLVVHFFCHLKAPDVGLPHERGGSVLSTQFAGSRAMMRSCNSMIGIEGNKDPDLKEEERNLRTLVLLEDRATGNAGKVRLLWNRNNGNFQEL